MTIEQLKALAANVPTEYPIEGLDAWDNLESVKLLSAACEDAGYRHLAKAVIGGKAWARKISCAFDEESLVIIDEYAGEPGWSWNENYLTASP